MAKHWRIHPHDSARIWRFGPLGRHPARRRPAADLPRHSRSGAGPQLSRAKLARLRDPGELPGRRGGGRADHGRHPGPAADRHLWRLRRRRHERPPPCSVGCLQAARRRRRLLRAHRHREGYGLNRRGARSAGLAEAPSWSSPSIAASPASSEAETARELGLELIITDHHELGRATAAGGGDRPSAAARQRLSVRRPVRLRRGVQAGLGLVPAGQRRQEGRPADEASFSCQAVGLAALGTVADVVPLVDENRVLVQHGLASLQQRPGLGIAALMRAGRARQEAAARRARTSASRSPRDSTPPAGWARRNWAWNC